METNKLIVSAVKDMAAVIAAILGTPHIDTIVNINGEEVLCEKHED